MLSYVLPAKEENGSNKNQIGINSHRNLNLNLPIKNLNEEIYDHKETDLMLANVSNPSEFCSDLTQLIGYDPSNSPKTNKRNCYNNNKCSDGRETVLSANDESFDEFDNSILESDSSFKQQISLNNPKKTKHCKLGSKGVGLKRVSFGSSKGSMVETLVFETPTPLSEHPEPSFESIPRSKSPSGRHHIDDSGIDVQEDSERSVVRVSIYQSNKPQQINHPDYLTKLTENLEESFSSYSYNIEDIMPSTAIPGYDRQQSTDSGWDNPFRPGGDLSREAEEIVNMIKGGKPITPTDEHKLENGNVQTKEEHRNGTTVNESVNKTNVTQVQSAVNGSGLNNHSEATKAKSNDNNGVTTSTNQVSKQVVPGPTSASHVIIDEKKNKKKGCCVLQ